MIADAGCGERIGLGRARPWARPAVQVLATNYTVCYEVVRDP